MAFSLPTNTSTVESWVGALYGYAIGSTTMAQVNADITSNGGLNNTLNIYYTAAFGSQTTASVATSIVANLGIVVGQNGIVAADVTQAVAYVTGVLNSTAANARGAAVLSIINLFNGLAGTTGSLANFSAAATTWSNTVATATTYVQTNTSDVALAAAATKVSTAQAAPSGTTLTSNPDTVTGSNVSVSGSVGSTTAAPTFSAGDSIVLTGTGNSLTVSDAATGGTWLPASVAGVTISGVQTVTYSSAEQVSANLTPTSTSQGYTGLTGLNVYTAGGSSITAPTSTATAAVATTISDTALNGGNISVDGGSSVNVTANNILASVGSTSPGTIKVGNTTAPTGAIAVNANLATTTLGLTSGATSDAITIKGGSTITVNQVIGAPTSSSATAVPPILTGNTAGLVTITGAAAGTVNTTGTTSVSVTQTPVVGPSVVITLAPFVSTAIGDYVRFNIGTSGASTGYTQVVSTATGSYTAAQVALVLAGGNVAGLALQRSVSSGTTVSGGSFQSFSNPTSTSITLTDSTVTNVIVGSGITAAVPAVTQPGVPLFSSSIAAATPTLSSSSVVTGAIFNAPVVITDANGSSSTAAGTITNVSLSGLNYDSTGSGGTVITDNALKTLSITSAKGGNGYASSVTITNNQQNTTSTTLGLTLNDSTVTVVDTNAELTTLNITASGKKSNLTFTGGTNVKTMTVAGSTLLAITGTNYPNLTSLTVSGSAGLSADVSSITTLTGFTSSSSGVIVATIDSTKQTFTSTGSGLDVITISSPATQAIKAGTNTGNMLVWSGAVPTSFLGTGGSLTGFSVLGTSTSTGTFNVGSIATATGNTFSKIDVAGSGSSALAFTNVTAGTGLNIDAYQKAGLTYATADSTGAANSLTINLGIAATDPRVVAGSSSATALGLTDSVAAASGVTTVSTSANNAAALTSLTLQDAATTQTVTNGVGTVTINGNASIGGVEVITTLTDSSLSTLNIAGNASTVISTLSGDLVTALTINNTSSATSTTGASTITNMTDNNLTSLTFTGPGLQNFGTLTSIATSLTIAQNNTNATTPTITSLTEANLATLNVSGAALTISAITNDTSSLLSINNTASGTLTITGMNDASLGTISVGGTGAVTFGATGLTTASSLTVIDTLGAALTIPAISNNETSITVLNTGTGTATIGTAGVTLAAISTASTALKYTTQPGGTTYVPNSLATINLVGAVNYYVNASGQTSFTTLSATSDNSTIQFYDAGQHNAAATITVGNGNNYLGLDDTSASSNITVGTGNNTILEIANAAGTAMTLSLGAGANNVKLGGTAHNAGVVNAITFTAANAASTSTYTTFANLSANDTFTFKFPAFNNNVVNVGAVSSIAAGIAASSAGNGYSYFNDGTNTYVFEQTGTAANNEIIAIVGAGHTFTATGVLTFAS